MATTLYVDKNFTAENCGEEFNTTKFSTINGALTAAKKSTDNITIEIAGGDYAENMVLSQKKYTVDGKDYVGGISFVAKEGDTVNVTGQFWVNSGSSDMKDIAFDGLNIKCEVRLNGYCTPIGIQSNASVTASGISVSNCTLTSEVEGDGTEGVAFGWGINADGVVISGNTILADCGIYTEGGSMSNAEITGNEIRGRETKPANPNYQGWAAIYINKAGTGVEISGNKVDDCAYAPVRVKGSAVVLSNNTFAACGDTLGKAYIITDGSVISGNTLDGEAITFPAYTGKDVFVCSGLAGKDNESVVIAGEAYTVGVNVFSSLYDYIPGDSTTLNIFGGTYSAPVDKWDESASIIRGGITKVVTTGEVVVDPGILVFLTDAEGEIEISGNFKTTDWTHLDNTTPWYQGKPAIESGHIRFEGGEKTIFKIDANITSSENIVFKGGKVEISEDSVLLIENPHLHTHVGTAQITSGHFCVYNEVINKGKMQVIHTGGDNTTSMVIIGENGESVPGVLILDGANASLTTSDDKQQSWQQDVLVNANGSFEIRSGASADINGLLKIVENGSVTVNGADFAAGSVDNAGEFTATGKVLFDIGTLTGKLSANDITFADKSVIGGVGSFSSGDYVEITGTPVVFDGNVTINTRIEAMADMQVNAGSKLTGSWICLCDAAKKLTVDKTAVVECDTLWSSVTAPAYAEINGKVDATSKVYLHNADIYGELVVGKQLLVYSNKAFNVYGSVDIKCTTAQTGWQIGNSSSSTGPYAGDITVNVIGGSVVVAGNDSGKEIIIADNGILNISSKEVDGVEKRGSVDVKIGIISNLGELNVDGGDLFCNYQIENNGILNFGDANVTVTYSSAANGRGTVKNYTDATMIVGKDANIYLGTLINEGELQISTSAEKFDIAALTGAGTITVTVDSEIGFGKSLKLIDVNKDEFTGEVKLADGTKGYTITEAEDGDIIVNNVITKLTSTADWPNAIADGKYIYIDSKININGDDIEEVVVANWERLIFGDGGLLLWGDPAFTAGTPEEIVNSDKIMLAPSKPADIVTDDNGSSTLTFGGEDGSNGFVADINNGDDGVKGDLNIINKAGSDAQIRSNIDLSNSDSDPQNINIENKGGTLQLTGSIQTGGNVSITNNNGTTGNGEAILNGGNDGYGVKIDAANISMTNNGHAVVDFTADDIKIINNSGNTLKGEGVAKDNIVIVADEGKVGAMEGEFTAKNGKIVLRDQQLTDVVLNATEGEAEAVNFFGKNNSISGDTEINIGVGGWMNIGRGTDVAGETYRGDAVVTVKADASVAVNTESKETGLKISGKEDNAKKGNGILNVYGNLEVDGKTIVDGTMNVGKAADAENAGHFESVRIQIGPSVGDLVNKASMTISDGATVIADWNNKWSGNMPEAGNKGVDISSAGSLTIANAAELQAFRVGNEGEITLSNGAVFKTGSFTNSGSITMDYSSVICSGTGFGGEVVVNANGLQGVRNIINIENDDAAATVKINGNKKADVFVNGNDTYVAVVDKDKVLLSQKAELDEDTAFAAEIVEDKYFAGVNAFNSVSDAVNVMKDKKFDSDAVIYVDGEVEGFWPTQDRDGTNILPKLNFQSLNGEAATFKGMANPTNLENGKYNSYSWKFGADLTIGKNVTLDINIPYSDDSGNSYGDKDYSNSPNFIKFADDKAITVTVDGTFINSGGDFGSAAKGGVTVNVNETGRFIANSGDNVSFRNTSTLNVTGTGKDMEEFQFLGSCGVEFQGVVNMTNTKVAIGGYPVWFYGPNGYNWGVDVAVLSGDKKMTVTGSSFSMVADVYAEELEYNALNSRKNVNFVDSDLYVGELWVEEKVFSVTGGTVNAINGYTYQIDNVKYTNTGKIFVADGATLNLTKTVVEADGLIEAAGTVNISGSDITAKELEGTFKVADSVITAESIDGTFNMTLSDAFIKGLESDRNGIKTIVDLTGDGDAANIMIGNENVLNGYVVVGNWLVGLREDANGNRDLVAGAASDKNTAYFDKNFTEATFGYGYNKFAETKTIKADSQFTTVDIASNDPEDAYAAFSIEKNVNIKSSGEYGVAIEKITGKAALTVKAEDDFILNSGEFVVETGSLNVEGNAYLANLDNKAVVNVKKDGELQVGTGVNNGTINVTNGWLYSGDGENNELYMENKGTINISGASTVSGNFSGNALTVAAGASIYCVGGLNADLYLKGGVTVDGIFSGKVDGNQVITLKALDGSDFALGHLTLAEGSKVKSITIDGVVGSEVFDVSNDITKIINGKNNAKLIVDGDALDGKTVTGVKIVAVDVDEGFLTSGLTFNIDKLSNLLSINGSIVAGNDAAGYRVTFGEGDDAMTYDVIKGKDGITFEYNEDIAPEDALLFEDFNGSMDNFAGAGDYVIEAQEGVANLKISKDAKASVKAIMQNDLGNITNISLGNNAALSVEEDIEAVGKLSTGTGAEVTVDGEVSGTHNNTSIVLGKENTAVFGSIDLMGGSNTLSIGSKSDVFVNGNVENVRNISLANGTADNVKTAENELDYSRLFIYGTLVSPLMANSITVGNYAMLYVEGGIENDCLTVGTTIKVGNNSGFFSEAKLESIAGITVGTGSYFSVVGDVAGISGNNTYKFGADSEVRMGNVDMKGGKNSFQVGARAEVIVGELENVSSVSIASGTFDKKAGEANETLFDADSISGSKGNDTVSFGNYNDSVIGSIDLGAGTDTIKIGNDSFITIGTVDDATDEMTGAGDIENVETIAIGARGEFVAGDITGVNKLTTGNGTAAKYNKDGSVAVESVVTYFRAEEITGTEKNNAVSFGAWNEINVDSIALGAGNDTVSFGNYTDVDIDSIDLGAGNDTVSFGNYTDVVVGSIDLGAGNDTLKIGNSCDLSIGTIEFGEAADGKDKDTLSIGKDSKLTVSGTTALDELEVFNAAKGAMLIVNNGENDVLFDNKMTGSWTNVTIEDDQGVLAGDGNEVTGQVYTNEFDVFTVTLGENQKLTFTDWSDNTDIWYAKQNADGSWGEWSQDITDWVGVDITISDPGTYVVSVSVSDTVFDKKNKFDKESYSFTATIA